MTRNDNSFSEEDGFESENIISIAYSTSKDSFSDFSEVAEIFFMFRLLRVIIL